MASNLWRIIIDRSVEAEKMSLQAELLGTDLQQQDEFCGRAQTESWAQAHFSPHKMTVIKQSSHKIWILNLNLVPCLQICPLSSDRTGCCTHSVVLPLMIFYKNNRAAFVWWCFSLWVQQLVFQGFQWRICGLQVVLLCVLVIIYDLVSNLVFNLNNKLTFLLISVNRYLRMNAD